MSIKNKSEEWKRKVIENIKTQARISITINNLWQDLHYHVRDRDLIIEAFTELLDEPTRPDLPEKLKDRKARIVVP